MDHTDQRREDEGERSPFIGPVTGSNPETLVCEPSLERMDDGDDSAFDFMGYLPELSTTMDNSQDESNISAIEPTLGNETSYYKDGQPEDGSVAVSSDQPQQRQLDFSGISNSNVPSGSSFLMSANEADVSNNVSAPMKDVAVSPLQIIPSSNPNSPRTSCEDLSSAIVDFIEQPDGNFAPNTKYSEASTQSGHQKSHLHQKRSFLRVAQFACLKMFAKTCHGCRERLTGDTPFTWQTMAFCSIKCISKYQNSFKTCAQCYENIPASRHRGVWMKTSHVIEQFCSNVCYNSFLRKSKACTNCQTITTDLGMLGDEDEKNVLKSFCCKKCFEEWKKSNENETDSAELCDRAVCEACLEDTICSTKLNRENGTTMKFCGLDCFTVFKTRTKLFADLCDCCEELFERPRMWPKLTIFGNGKDAHLCGCACFNRFVEKTKKAAYCSGCKLLKFNYQMIEVQKSGGKMDYYCCVHCLQQPLEAGSPPNAFSKIKVVQLGSTSSPSSMPSQSQKTPCPMKLKTYVKTTRETIVLQPEPVPMRNKCTSAKPLCESKGISCTPMTTSISTQTDELAPPALVPIGVPMFVPFPFGMYHRPYPVPVPIPIPVPVPIFIPTTRNSFAEISHDIEQIKKNIPSDGYRNEVQYPYETMGANVYSHMPENIDQNVHHHYDTHMNYQPQLLTQPNTSKRKLQHVGYGENEALGARYKQRSGDAFDDLFNRGPGLSGSPDEYNHLKFTYGVNAWKHWIIVKNADAERKNLQGRFSRIFETDILKLGADELNYTLSMFVQEAKKPDGEQYTPDNILYFVYGIQEYLYENGRLENIFTDTFFEPFTSALHNVINGFRLPRSELGEIITRIDEEHLWESKQLGAHSPSALLNTLVYYNTKFFKLGTLDDHLKLAFVNLVEKPDPSGRCTKSFVLIRDFSSERGFNQPFRTVELCQNTMNPLRCPVKLYEFYLSKCSFSVKFRDDVFYLQPERPCVPESHLWYTPFPLPSLELEKMLQRILLVKEIQECLLQNVAPHFYQF